MYYNFRALQEIFLTDNPIPNLDLGMSLDRYVYGHPTPIETESLISLLGLVPSSKIVALIFDFSFIPLASLPKEAGLKRLLGWKSSSLKIKRGLYSIFRQFCFFLASSDRQYQAYAGYRT